MPRYDTYKSFMDGRVFGRENSTAERTAAAVMISLFMYFWDVPPDDGYLVQPKRVAF